MAMVPAWVPDLPLSATSSLSGFSELLEAFVHHRLPSAYIGLVFLYACGHVFFFILCLPYFSKQIKSGRFWLVRLVPTERGRIIVPNHLDASATLIGAYTIYDVGYCIKLILCYYQRSSQNNLPALLCLRFIILTTIGWIFLLGFFLVKVPPNRLRIPAWTWNIGIFAIPLAIHFASLILLIKSTQHWNSYWAIYELLRPEVKTALANGVVYPSLEQIDLARQMLGVELRGYSRFVLFWGIPYMLWAIFFATTILTVTLKILTTHWHEVKGKEDLPMQSRRTEGFSMAAHQRSMTTSMGIRRWIKGVTPSVQEEQQQRSFMTVMTSDTAQTTSTAMDDKVNISPFHAAAQGQSAGKAPHGKGQHARPTASRLLLYGLGLRPLTKDAYNDPSGGFSESKARAGLRSLLTHTAIQGGCIFIIALTQIGACLIMVHPVFLQPLDGKSQMGGWVAQWIQLSSALRLLEFYGAALPGIALIISILTRQMHAIGISNARETQGVPITQTHRTGEDFALSAPGPSVSARWSIQRKAAPPALGLPLSIADEQDAQADKEALEADAEQQDDDLSRVSGAPFTTTNRSASALRPSGRGEGVSVTGEGTSRVTGSGWATFQDGDSNSSGRGRHLKFVVDGNTIQASSRSPPTSSTGLRAQRAADLEDDSVVG